MKPRIGVLALQGDFKAHQRALERAGAEALAVRTRAELETVDGLVIPGGESTTMLKLLDAEGLFEPLKDFGSKKPIFGTCAGVILLANKVQNPEQRSLGLLNVTVERNAYGRQIDSRIVPIEVAGKSTEAVFIRAPIIREVGPAVHVLASYLHTPVLIEEGRHIASTFHPELSADARIHQLFVRKVAECEKREPRYTEET